MADRRRIHPFVELFAAQQKRELAAEMSRDRDDDHDVVKDGRIQAPDVRAEFNRHAPDQEVTEKDRDERDDQERGARTPKDPTLRVRPPFVRDLGPGGGGGGPPVEPKRSDPQPVPRKTLKEKVAELELSRSPRAAFGRAKNKSLAERRFNAAARDRDQERER